MTEHAHNPRVATLRQQAEDHVFPSRDTTQLSTEAIDALVHELQVHQVELQLQNEELLQAREDAEAERNRFAELYDSVPVGCLTVDRESVILEANRASRLFLVGPVSELIGRRLTDFVALEDQDAHFLFFRQLFQTKRQEGNLRLLQPEGGSFVAAMDAQVVATGPGAGERCRMVLRDITEQEQLEGRLRQTQKMEALGTLAGGIAHDFNNILTIILGFTNLSEMSLPEHNPARNYLHEVSKAAHRAKDLVQHILTFTQQLQPERQLVQVYPLVQDALRLIQASLPATIALQSCLDPGAGVVLAQATDVHQMLINLCANAEYAMRQHEGTLRIGLDVVEVDAPLATAHLPLEPGPHVRLTVEDTGPGIAAELLPHIFEPYYTTKGPGEGSGLGLAVVHGMVANHQGAITVESTPSVRTIFTVYLSQVADSVPEVPAVPEALPRGTERILLVDDEPSVARATELQLMALGYTVITHHTSTSALDAVRADPQQFDLVITDQTMPIMTGEDLSRALHRLRPDLPVILITGFSHLIDAEKAQALGIDAFFLKPWDEHEMAHTIRRVLT